MFQAQSEATLVSSQGPVRKSLRMEILSPSAYGQVFQVWFEREGFLLPLDQIERKTLGQMKAFCERLATRDGVMIQSQYVKYHQDIKALAKERS